MTVAGAGPTLTPIQWEQGAKRPGIEVDHSPPCSAEVKGWVELYLHSPYTRLLQYTAHHRQCPTCSRCDGYV